MRVILAGMEPEKFLILTHTEFRSLLKVTEDERERCILLLLAGAGLRVSEMTQIRTEDLAATGG
jgi:integrase